MKSGHISLALAVLSCVVFGQGCGLIFGGDQRVDNKSHDYTVVRLDRDPSHEWRVLAPPKNEKSRRDVRNSPVSAASEEGSPEEAGDLAFEHVKSGAIISLNSVCREYRDASLEDLSRYLLLGLNTNGPVVTHDIEIDKTKALESTVNASMTQRRPSGNDSEEQPVQVRAVVMRKSGCTYDLMFIARPEVFDSLSTTFDRFLKGFHAQ